MFIHSTFSSAQEAQTAASQHLRNTLQELITLNKPTLMLLSGGSNIQVAAAVDHDILHHSLITRMALDERFTQDTQQNNSLLLQMAGVDVVPTIPHPQETLEQFGQRFALLLKTWLDDNPNGKVICTLGMGADGHIAGISPFPNDKEQFSQLFLKTNELAIGYTGNLQPPQRVTVTPTFLTRVDTIVTCITGEEKRAVLKTFVQHSSQPHQHPVQLLHTLPAAITLYTDQSLE